MLNNSSVLFSMTFCETAPTSDSCYLFLLPLVITWIKIFKQMLSTWTLPKLSIPSITQFCFKSSNDMVWKAAHCLVYRLPKWKISKGHFGWCCLAMGSSYIRSSSGQPNWPSSICSFYLWFARCSTGRYLICSLRGQSQSLQFYLVCRRLWTTTTSSDKPPFLESQH